jgi:hypothetical protein
MALPLGSFKQKGKQEIKLGGNYPTGFFPLVV